MGCRLFIAIDLPGHVRHTLGRLLLDPQRGVRPVPTGQMHLTLHFLGDVENDRREQLVAALHRLREAPFAIAIRGAGTFPPRGRPSVLWAGVADSASLFALRAIIGQALESCRLDIDHRPYAPHVTLARLTPAVPRSWVTAFLAANRPLAIDGIPVDRFHLYASTRRDGMTEHTIEASFPLGEASRDARP